VVQHNVLHIQVVVQHSVLHIQVVVQHNVLHNRTKFRNVEFIVFSCKLVSYIKI
jgi:hypothetical protein